MCVCVCVCACVCACVCVCVCVCVCLDGWQNLKDFYNLINVYMDSVLHPAITPWTLKQEGWHYDIEDVYSYVL